MSVASKTMPLGKIYEYAYSLIGQRLSMINGVSEVVTYGEPSAVRVQVDPDYLAAHQIGINEVADVIVNSNPQQPTGNLYGPNHEYIINIDWTTQRRCRIQRFDFAQPQPRTAKSPYAWQGH